MGRIVAIGGGEIITTPSETIHIDREIIRLSGKSNPKLCFISTASHDAPEYIKSVKKYFGNELNCRVYTLELFNKQYTFEEMERLLLSMDIIYVGGGETTIMLQKWQEKGLDRILKEIYQSTEIILSGLSAGAMCWFSGATCYNRELTVESLNLEPYYIIPHYEDSQEEYIKTIQQNITYPIYRVRDGEAITVIDKEVKLLNVVTI